MLLFLDDCLNVSNGCWLTVLTVLSCQLFGYAFHLFGMWLHSNCYICIHFNMFFLFIHSVVYRNKLVPTTSLRTECANLSPTDKNIGFTYNCYFEAFVRTEVFQESAQWMPSTGELLLLFCFVIGVVVIAHDNFCILDRRLFHNAT